MRESQVLTEEKVTNKYSLNTILITSLMFFLIGLYLKQYVYWLVILSDFYL